MYKFTGGYCIDKTCGNSENLGGLFGPLYVIGGGLPLPEGKPWQPSLEWEIFENTIPQIGREWKKLSA